MSHDGTTACIVSKSHFSPRWRTCKVAAYEREQGLHATGKGFVMSMCPGKTAFEALSDEVRAELRAATSREEAYRIMEAHREELATACRRIAANPDGSLDLTGCEGCPVEAFEH